VFSTFSLKWNLFVTTLIAHRTSFNDSCIGTEHCIKPNGQDHDF